MAVSRPLPGAYPHWLQGSSGWEHGVWDVAASLGYVACDKYGLARSAELCCGLACCWLGSCQYFQERGEGREGETSLPVPWLLTLPVHGWAAWGLPGPTPPADGRLWPGDVVCTPRSPDSCWSVLGAVCCSWVRRWKKPSSGN